MPEILLPASGRATSRLGFGCARLFGGSERRESLALLHAAYEAGVRHFDVAPYYGLGTAEEVVGSFLASHRDKVTVTTKFGLRPPYGKHLFRAARSAIKPFRDELPHLMLKAARRLTPPPRFSTETLEASLRESLGALRCETIDLLLLHEAEAHDLTDELLQSLERAVARGLIGGWGIGSAREKIDRLTAEQRPTVGVLQFEWSVLSEDPPHYPGCFTITHGALAGAFTRVTAALAEPARETLWSAIVGADLADRRVLARLMLAAASRANPTGIVLFSSSQPSRIREDMSAWTMIDDACVARFIELVAGDRQAMGTIG